MKPSPYFLTAATLFLSGLSPHAHAQEELPNKLEKCYGLSKAGKNSCAAADGSHRCATYSKREGYGHDFINLPAGLCERLIGGSLTPTKAAGRAVAVQKNKN